MHLIFTLVDVEILIVKFTLIKIKLKLKDNMFNSFLNFE